MSKLALPPIGAIQDRAVQQALQAIQSWARHVDEQYLTLSDINTPNGRGTQQLVRTVNNIVEATVRQAKTAAEVDRKNREAAAQVVRNILQNSGTEPPVEMNSPVLFRAGTSTTNVYIGAGGVGGANSGVATFGLDASDGSFFFGKTTLPSKQITFDASSGTLTFGSDIVVNTTGTPSLATIASNASSAYSGLSNKLNKNASDTLSGTIDFASSGAFKVGTVTWNGTSATGTGVMFTQNGIVGVNGGSIKFVIKSDGTATFGGELSAATGSFAGTLDVGSYIALTRSGSEVGRLRSYAIGGVYGAGMYSSKNLDFHCEYTVGSEANTGQINLTGVEHVALTGGDTYGNYLKVSDSGVVFSGPLKNTSGTEVSLSTHNHDATYSNINHTHWLTHIYNDSGGSYKTKFRYSTDGSTWTNIYLWRYDW